MKPGSQFTARLPTMLVATLGLAATGAAQRDLLVSSGLTDQVLRYNGTSGAFVGVFAQGGGLDLPRELALGPDGNLYVASFLSDQILRYSGTDGAFIDAFVPAGSGGLDGPTELIFGPDGSLYVASFLSDQVLRYSGANGAFIDAFVTAGSGGLDGPVGMLFGPGSDLYVGSALTDEVLRYSGATGIFLGVFVAAGSGGLDSPSGMLSGADGRLYVGSFHTDEVLRYSTTGAFVGAFVAAGSGGLDIPTGSIFGGDGHLYVSSFATDQVLRYDKTTGAFIDAFVSAGSGGLDGPGGVLFFVSGVEVRPQSFTLLRGLLLSGGLSDLFESDDRYVRVRPGVVLSGAEAPVQVIVDGASPTAALTRLRFKLEAAVSIPNLAQRIELYNFGQGRWELVDTRSARTADTVVEFETSSNASRFVHPTNRLIRARVSWKEAGPVFSYPWVVRIDQTIWALTP